MPNVASARPNRSPYKMPQPETHHFSVFGEVENALKTYIESEESYLRKTSSPSLQDGFYGLGDHQHSLQLRPGMAAPYPGQCVTVYG